MSHNCNTYLKWLFCSSLIILHTFFLCYPLLLSYSYFAKLLFLSFSFLLLQFYTVYIHIHLHRVCIAAYEMGKLTYSNSAFKPSFMSIKTCSIYTYIHMYVRMNCKYISFFLHNTQQSHSDNNECNQTFKTARSVYWICDSNLRW